MSITWKKRERDPDTGKEVWIDDGETHVGLVMSESFKTEERVMSDIYADVSHCWVWNPEKKHREQVTLGYHFELGHRFGFPVVDIDPEILRAWQEEQAEAALRQREANEAHREAELEAEAERELKEPKKGDRAVVVKGRKVPKGTVGVIIWEGSNQYGPRIGLKDDDGKVHWTATSNVEVAFPGLKPGEAPRGGWRGLRARMQQAQKDWENTFPEKGDWVSILDSGIRGRVFWVKGERIGMKRDGAPPDEDPIWKDAWEVAVIDASGGVLSQTPVGPAAVPVHDPNSSQVPQAPPEPTKKSSTKPSPVPSKKNPLAHLPFPLCEITCVEKDGDSWKAFTADGEFVMKLAEQGAYDILALLEGASKGV